MLPGQGPVVVYFWSKQSGDMFGQALGDVSGDFEGKATIVRMDVDANPATWNAYRDTGDYSYDERKQHRRNGQQKPGNLSSRRAAFCARRSLFDWVKRAACPSAARRDRRTHPSR
jgi:hypothetical protein